jgi:putative FmdB family regulatory protein
MPLYEYTCRRCGETIEVLQRVGQPDPERCGEDCVLEGPASGQGVLERQLSVPGGYAMGRGSAPPPRERCEGCPGEGSCGVDS